MIVKVCCTNGPRLFIPIPAGLFCNRLTAGLAAKAMAQNGWDATPEQMVKLFRTIRQCRQRHPGLALVEVQSAEGDYVYVKI